MKKFLTDYIDGEKMSIVYEVISRVEFIGSHLSFIAIVNDRTVAFTLYPEIENDFEIELKIIDCIIFNNYID